jgi:hypothetical protein
MADHGDNIGIIMVRMEVKENNISSPLLTV